MNHIINAEQAQALKLALPQHFAFDLVNHIEDLPETPLRADILATLAFSADGYISATLNKLLTGIYNEQRAGEAVTFNTYTEFLDQVRALNFSDWMANDAEGIEHTRQTLQALVDIRQAMHAVIAMARPSYEIPEITDTLENPRLRNASADTLLKMEDLAREIAEGDEELASELRTQFSRKHRGNALQRLEWDKQRGKVTSLLFHAFNLTLDAGDEDPYMQLPANIQLGMIRSAMKAIDRSVERAMDDNRVTTVEFAKLRVEAKAIKRTLEVSAAHARFSELA